MDIALCRIDIWSVSRFISGSCAGQLSALHLPPGTDWTLEWHEILHQWNVRMNIFLDRANIKTWSHICCLGYWRLAQHIATLPQERWIRRILRWYPAGRHRTGRPHFHWESKLESYCRYKGLGRWIEAAMNRDVWDQHCKSFSEFCCT